jgi:hypothetical protein
MNGVEELGYQTIFVVVLSLIIVFGLLSFLLWNNWRKEGVRGDLCLYSGRPMRLGVDIARSMADYINEFLKTLPNASDNPPIDMTKAAFCPVTGRIFPDCVSSSERINLGWDFLSKRCPGTFVSWGSLPEHERGELKLLHSSFDGFQTEKSSPLPRPQNIDEQYALLAPGPLYVDRVKKVVIGWKKVPGTYFEVLVVQRPVFQSIEETL